jgi:class 3 adenylate cyclase
MPALLDKLFHSLRALQAEPWPLKPWGESPKAYRVWVATAYVITGALAVIAYLYVAAHGKAFDSWWLAPGAALLTGVMIVKDLRATATSGWDAPALVASTLVISGHTAEGAIAILAAYSVGALFKPAPLFVYFQNALAGLCGTFVSGALMVLVAHGTLLTARWLVACALVWVVWALVDGAVIAPPFVLGGYSTKQEEVSAWLTVVKSYGRSMLPLSVMGGLLIALHEPWALAVLVVPYLIMQDVFAQSARAVDEATRSAFLQTTFSGYLPASMVDQIVESGSEIELGGEQREITVLFCDIRGFTSWSEKHDPQHIIEELNQLLSALTDCVFDSEGTLDKFTGDGLMAFWGAPLDQPDHASRAVAAAQGMVQRLAEHNAGRAEDERFRLGIGLHTGLAVVGNVGHDRRHDYTAIGDTVNLSARIEAATKDAGAELLISDETLQHLTGEEQRGFRMLGPITVKGRRQPVTIHAVSAVPADAVPESDVA